MELFFGDFRDRRACGSAMMDQFHGRGDGYACMSQRTAYSVDLPSPKRFVQAGGTSAA
jgi:hypothetical protein